MIKSIIFSTPMVRAILDGRKTMTRRVIKPQPKCKLCYIFAGGHNGKWHYPDKDAAQCRGEAFRLPEGLSDADRNAFWTPPCRVDDILWVRETWAPWSRTMGIAPKIYYRADGAPPAGIKWRPSIHMPREAARIFPRVTSVRVERLQEISGADIALEGVGKGEFFNTVGKRTFYGALSDRAAFRELWDSLSNPFDIDKYGWEANPLVWVISFERCEKPNA